MGHYLDLLLDRPLAQRVALIAGLVLALAAADYALVHRRQAARIARIADDLDRFRLREARARSELRRLPQLREEAAAQRRELRSRLPAGPARRRPWKPFQRGRPRPDSTWSASNPAPPAPGSTTPRRSWKWISWDASTTF